MWKPHVESEPYGPIPFPLAQTASASIPAKEIEDLSALGERDDGLTVVFLDDQTVHRVPNFGIDRALNRRDFLAHPTNDPLFDFGSCEKSSQAAFITSLNQWIVLTRVSSVLALGDVQGAEMDTS